MSYKMTKHLSLMYKLKLQTINYETLTLLPEADLWRLLPLGEFGMLLLEEAASDPVKDFLLPGAGEFVALPAGLYFAPPVIN